MLTTVVAEAVGEPNAGRDMASRKLGLQLRANFIADRQKGVLNYTFGADMTIKCATRMMFI